MGLKVYTTQSVTALTGAEISLLEDAARACGRATLLVPSFAERDVCRRALADARVGTGVDVTTPEAWIEGLWELFGDGRRVVSSLERRMLVSALMDRRDAGQIAPLRDNPGPVRLISQIAEALLPEIAA
ncbi:MAG: PD-(D/E)XK nuclease family protein, partial [Collinsella intestinalis]